MKKNLFLVALVLLVHNFLFAQGTLIVQGQIHESYNHRIIQLYNFVGQQNNVAIQKVLSDTIVAGKFYFKMDSAIHRDLYFLSCEVPNQLAVNGKELKRKGFFVDTGMVSIVLDSNFNKTLKGTYLWDKQYDSLLQYQRGDLYGPREITNAGVAFIKNDPSSPLSSQVLFRLYNEVPDQQLDSLYRLIPEHNFQNSVGKYVKKLLDSAIVGKMMASFRLPDTCGVSVDSKEFKGRYVFYDVWASWCGPCRKESSYIKKLYEKFKDKLVVVQISLDKDKAKWLQAIREDELRQFIHLSDLKDFESEFARQFHINSIPANMLVDRNGKIIARKLRGKRMIEMVKKLISK